MLNLMHKILITLNLLAITGWSSLALADFESDQLAAQKAQLEADVNQLNAEITNTQTGIQNQQAELDRLMAEENRLRDQYSAQNAEDAALDSRLNQVAIDLAETQARLEGARQAQAVYESQLTDLRQQKAQLDSLSVQIQAENLTLIDDNKAMESDIVQKKERIAELQQKTSEAQKTLDEESAVLAKDFNLASYLSTLEDLKSSWEKLKALRFDAHGELPRASVGMLKTPFGVCTAFLVAKDRIRTAAHCVHGIENVREGSGYTFFTVDGTGVKVLYPTRHSERADMIELKLKEDVGLSTIQEGKLDPNNAVDLVAYNLMTAEYVTKSCQVLNGLDPRGVIKTDCDTGLGMSGAPLFQRGQVVGYHVGKLGDQSIAMVLEPSRGQELSDSEAYRIQYHYNCDSDCSREIGFDRPCPTLKKPGRMCRESKTIVDPICAAGKQQDCAVRAIAREAERALGRLKEELRNGINSLGFQTSQLKISLDGLRSTLRDVSDAAVGRNQSVKDLQSKILDGAARIDTKRAEITRRALLVDEMTRVAGEVLKTIGVSQADVENIKGAMDSTTTVNVKMASDNRVLREAGDALRNEQKNIANEVSIARVSLDNVKKEIAEVREEAIKSVNALNDKIQDLPREISVPRLPDVGIENFNMEDTRRELRKFDLFVSRNAAAVRKWLGNATTPSDKSGCDVDSIIDQQACLDQKKMELEDKQNTLGGIVNQYYQSIKAKLERIKK